ncbi:MAG: hypothetical protein HN337_00355 [Deltaproteobacteria bacterium]|jgi:hypothetical protein|nr:hypothetical protein [Deltaproteobacteria bacterium]
MFRRFVGLVGFLIFSVGIIQTAYPCSPMPPPICLPNENAYEGIKVPRNTYIITGIASPDEIEITLRSEDGESVVPAHSIKKDLGTSSFYTGHIGNYFQPDSTLLPNTKYVIEIIKIGEEDPTFDERVEKANCSFTTSEDIDEDPPDLNNATISINLDWADNNEKYYGMGPCYGQSIENTKDAKKMDGEDLELIPENYYVSFAIEGVENVGGPIIHDIYMVDSSGNKTFVSRGMGVHPSLGLRLADEVDQKESYNIYLEDIFGNKQVVPIRTGFAFNKDKSKYLAMIGDREFKGDGTHEAAIGGGTGGGGTIAGDSSCTLVQGRSMRSGWIFGLLILLSGALIWKKRRPT